jgi:cold shock CspA family protein
VDAEDPSIAERYYQGTILRVYPGSRTGWLSTAKGREVSFVARDLQLLGAAQGFSTLRAGLRVGFDLGRTSRGLCVTTIRVYEGSRS